MELLIQQAVFTGFRPVFITLIAIAVIFLILSIVPSGRNNQLNFLTILIVSIIDIIIASILFFTESEMVQTLELVPDQLTLYLFLAIVVISIISPIIYRVRNRGGSRYRYRY